MREALLVPVLALAVIGCGRAEREATKSILASAYATRGIATDLHGRYSRAFDGPSGWTGVMAFRDSAEGLKAREILTGYSHAVAVDVGFRRTADLREATLVTAELANIVLEPRGTWISYGLEVNAITTRFDRAVLALEAGADTTTLAEAREEFRRQLASYSSKLDTAKALAEEAERDAEAKVAAEATAAKQRRQADLAAQEQRLKARDEELARQRAERDRKAAEAIASPPAPSSSSPKLGGGKFR